MNLDELEYKAKIALAAYPNWIAHPTEAGQDQMRTFPWLLDHKKGAYIPTLVANHIEAVSPSFALELIEEIRKRDALLARAKKFAIELGNVPYDWTEHAPVTYREIQVEKETIKDASVWLDELEKLKSPVKK